MIIKKLQEEFNEYFNSPSAELILWLDNTIQWKSIIDLFKKEFELIEYKGSQLEIKAKVELAWKKGNRPKFIIYLPRIRRDDLTVLKEYEFSGKMFDETILQTFKRWGIEFSNTAETELVKILPVAVQYYHNKNIDFWKDNDNPLLLRAKLCDDETVRKMLANPENTVHELKETERYEIFYDYINDRFGGPSLKESTLATWRRYFTAYLVFTEVRAGTNYLPSFPKFDIPYADDKYEANCITFLRDWLRNATYKEDFKRLSNLIEKKFDLSLWAAELVETPKCESSLAVEKVIEKNLLSKINNVKTLDELRKIFSEEKKRINEMAEHFWSCEEEIVAWKASKLANQIISDIDNCTTELDRIHSDFQLVQRYVNEWWKIDKNYRSYRSKYDGENRLSSLSKYIFSIHRDFQIKINEKFINLIKQVDLIEFEGVDTQANFWEKSVVQSKKKKAIFLVDALRFELACDLKERLSISLRDINVKCSPLTASVPTLTQIGMAAIISGKDTKVDLSADGNWQIRSTLKQQSGNLSIKSEREKFLKKRHPKALFYELSDLLKPTDLKIQNGNPIIIFTQEMDGHGHDSGVLNLSLDYFGQYLEGLIRAIRRLGSLGIEEIHIISDHGFLILDDVTEADKVTIPKDMELLYKGHRCLVGKELTKELGVVLNLPFDNDLQFAVPQGIGVFKTRGKKEFFHGGLSLQELIIPHIEIMFAKLQPKYGAKLKAPHAIYNLIFNVEILRAIPGEGILFGDPRYVEIIGYLDKNNNEIIRQSSPEMVINQKNETLEIRLRIKQGVPFKFGDIIRLELKDADTGELLDSIKIPLEVESNE